MEEPIFLWVFIPILVWFILLAVVFVLLLAKFTFNHKRPNPYEQETFAMPRGVFRGFLTLSVLFVVLVLEAANVGLLRGDAIRWSRFQEALQPLLTAFQMILSFYFGGKILGHLAEVDKDRSKMRLETALGRQRSQEEKPTSERDAVG